jgi:branched-chain amino acid transport system ATP-binding protein
MSDPVLSAVDVTKSFGGLIAVGGVSVDIEEGEIVGLIGPNGAGKSTLFDLLSGFQRPDTGTVYLNGTDVTGRPPHERAVAGLVRTFQISRELAGMTVEENMRLAGKHNPSESMIGSLSMLVNESARETEIEQEAERLLKEIELWELRDEYAGNLSGGQRKLLEFGRALMTDPDILLLDEPMAGVNPRLTDDLLELIRLLNDRGMTFLIVEHDINLIASLSERIVAMVDGKVLTTGPPSEVQQNEELLEAYLGG